jgi:hypothetical protein
MSEPDTNSPNADAAPAGPNVLGKREDIRDAIAAVAALGRREIIVFSAQLDAFYFNQSQLGRTLASFAARHGNNRARLLVEDASQVLRDNDRLVTICRRMSEFIQIREVAEEHRGLREMYVVADGEAYVHQVDTTQPQCMADVAGRRHAIELRRVFNQMWERSEPLTGLYVAGLSS